MYRIALLLAAIAVVAQPKKPEPKNAPKILVVFPLGLAPGSNAKLTLRGLNLDTSTEAKLPGGKGTVKLVRKGKVGVSPMQKADKVGDSEAGIDVTLPADIAEGTVAVELVTPGGSTTHNLLVARGVVAEKEPNNGYRQAQVITLPAMIEGAIGSPQDVDVFRIQGKAGQKIVAEVWASRHGSPLDGLLMLTDDRDAILVTSDDVEGVDPKIEYTLPRDGVYHLSLIDAHDQGGANFVYRLRIR